VRTKPYTIKVNHRFHPVILKYFAALILSAAVGFITTSALAADSRSINLSVTTHLGDTQSFRDGDIVSFYVSLDKDAYLIIIYQDARGQLSVLLPNPLYPDNFFRAGLFVPIPNEHNPFQFRITPPFGKETLWVFASDKPLEDASPVLSQLNGSLASVRNTINQQCRKQKAVCEEASLGITTTAARPKQ
jgi:hypothetical protein